MGADDLESGSGSENTPRLARKEPDRPLDRRVECQPDCLAQAVFALFPVDCNRGGPFPVRRTGLRNQSGPTFRGQPSGSGVFLGIRRPYS